MRKLIALLSLVLVFNCHAFFEFDFAETEVKNLDYICQSKGVDQDFPDLVLFIGSNIDETTGEKVLAISQAGQDDLINNSTLGFEIVIEQKRLMRCPHCFIITGVHSVLGPVKISVRKSGQDIVGEYYVDANGMNVQVSCEEQK